LHLAVGQLRRGYLLLTLVTALGHDRELGDQLGRHRRADERLPVVHRAYDVGDLIDRDVLQQVSGRAGLDRLEEVLLLVADGQHDDLDARHLVLDGGARLDATAAWHPDVHEHDVRYQVAHLLHGLLAVAALADDLDAVLVVEDHLQTTAEQSMVIDDEDADGITGHGVTSLRSLAQLLLQTVRRPTGNPGHVAGVIDRGALGRPTADAP